MGVWGSMGEQRDVPGMWSAVKCSRSLCPRGSVRRKAAVRQRAPWLRHWGRRRASHRLGDVGLPPVHVLQRVVLGVGQAPPVATGTWSPRRADRAGPRCAGSRRSDERRMRYSRIADVLEHRGEGLGLQATGLL